MDEFEARVGNLSEKKRALLELLLKEAGQQPPAQAESQLLSAGRPEASERDGSPPSLVPLRPTGTRPPFFCVHASGGSVFTYAGLIPRLVPDQPIYGLEAAGLNGEEPPLDRVEAMADRYVGALRSLGSRGPFLLGGWSMGGAVAFEMASLLLRAGEEVALLALIDVSVPDPSEPPTEVETLRAFVYDLASLMGKPPPEVDQRVAEMDPQSRLATVLEVLCTAELVPPEVDGTFLRNRLDVFRANVQAAYRYSPDPYPERITLIRAGESPDTTAAWSRMALGGIEDHVIPGDHYSIWAEPNLSALGEALQASINRALATSSIAGEHPPRT